MTIHIAKNNKNRNRVAEFIPIVLSILTFFMTLTIAFMQYRQVEKWKQIDAALDTMQVEQIEKWERVKSIIAENDLEVSRSTCITSLLPHLFSGDSCKMNTSLVLIKNLGDSTLVEDLCIALASNICASSDVKETAVEILQNSASGSKTINVIRKIQETDADSILKEKAKKAEKDIVERTISTSQVLIKQGRTKLAVDNFNVASQYFLKGNSEFENRYVDKQLLLQADSLYKAGKIDIAAKKYQLIYKNIKFRD